MFSLLLQLNRVQIPLNICLQTCEVQSGLTLAIRSNTGNTGCGRLALFSMALAQKPVRTGDMLLREMSSTKAFSTPAMWEDIT